MKVSYNTMVWSSSGTVYRQRVALTEREFEKIKDAFLCEIAMGFPQKEKYSYECDEVLKCYFKEPKLEKFKAPYLRKPINVAYLTLTQARYLEKFVELKHRLKSDRNTYIQIVS